jgi:hypothetical protein
MLRVNGFRIFKPLFEEEERCDDGEVDQKSADWIDVCASIDVHHAAPGAGDADRFGDKLRAVV